MSFWKMLGGAAIGVGAVAAAPFTGGGSILGAATLLSSLAGAGTIAAAVGAGVAGAAVAANIGDDDDEIRTEGIREGRKQAKAEQSEEISQLYNKLEIALKKLKESALHFDAILAMEAVAVAVANCDGVICDQEKAEIELFIAGVSRSTLPKSVKARIKSLYEQPVSLAEAFAMARNSGLEMDVFEEIIALVMHADGVIHSQERAFFQAWHKLKTA